MNNQEYWDEVRSSANYVAELALEAHDNDVDEAREAIWDHALHEYVDSHEWIIYTRFHLPILEHTDNQEYAADNFGAEFLAETLKESGLHGLHQAIAFYAFYQDIADLLDDAIDAAANNVGGDV